MPAAPDSGTSPNPQRFWDVPGGRADPLVPGEPARAHGAAGIAVLLLRNADARRMMFGGTLALAGGVGVALLSLDARSAVTFFVGTTLAGIGFGAGFHGAIRTIVPLAAPHERSGLLSTFYLISYLALAVPTIIGGALIVHGGLSTTTYEYGLAVIVLAALALLGFAIPRTP